MLSNEQKTLLSQLLAGLSSSQKIWLAGYMQAVADSGTDSVGLSLISDVVKPNLNVYFATETGNAKRVAGEFVKAAKAQGFKANSQPIKKLDLNKAEGIYIFICATHGEGDPPEDAVKFYETLRSKQYDLSKVEFSALGLGDSSYAEFCKAAQDLTDLFIVNKAKIFTDIVKLDVDFDSHIPQRIETVLKSVPNGNGQTLSKIEGRAGDAVSSTIGYNRLNPIVGKIIEHINLNDTGSNKETYHIEVEFDSDIQYQPGDAIGIILPAGVGQEGDNLAPRLYSIASSQAQCEKQIHMTVALSTYKDANGKQGVGLCSGYLSNLKNEDNIQFYVHRNSQFKLPENDDADIIMVGPGTGIAPFRAFIQERDARGASGKNWLFFGEQHQHTDFLYQAEWQDYVQGGLLNEIDLAFSRDQKEKVYVQHLMQKKADKLLEWFDNGAYLYICGQKDPMSRDVENTLIDILSNKKSISKEAAQALLDDWQEQGRYLKDVY